MSRRMSLVLMLVNIASVRNDVSSSDSSSVMYTPLSPCWIQFSAMFIITNDLPDPEPPAKMFSSPRLKPPYNSLSRAGQPVLTCPPELKYLLIRAAGSAKQSVPMSLVKLICTASLISFSTGPNSSFSNMSAAVRIARSSSCRLVNDSNSFKNHSTCSGLTSSMGLIAVPVTALICSRVGRLPWSSTCSLINFAAFLMVLSKLSGLQIFCTRTKFCASCIINSKNNFCTSAV